MKVDFATDVGAVRTSNQDTCECGVFSENSAWAIVCDGMGGANGGNIASAVAVEKIRNVITAGYQDTMSQPNLKNLMLNSVNQANTAVFDMAMEKEELRGMGTTVVLMIAQGDTLHVVHAGDSRAYLKDEDGVSQITMDHSYVQNLVNFGQITQEEAKVHPQRNIITKVVGVHDEIECDYSSCPFLPGDVALACSDGLSNYVDDSLLEEYIDKYKDDGKLLPEQLIQYAVEKGGADNITVAVIVHD